MRLNHWVKRNSHDEHTTTSHATQFHGRQCCRRHRVDHVRKSYGQVAGANERLRVWFIGCGGMAGAHLGALLELKEEENVDIVGVCDVYRKRAEDFAARVKYKGGDATVSQEYRDILDRDDIDYVVIATPEHSHAYLTLDVVAAGKHVYCEKPMTHNITDSKKVVEAVAKTDLKMQVGVQAMADDSYSSALAAIQAEFPDVKMGSYPQMGQSRVMTELVLRSHDEARLEQAAARVRTMVAEAHRKAGVVPPDEVY